MEKNTITSQGHTFDLVDEIPLGYIIWNIGKNMVDGYLPLCRLRMRQPFPGGRCIEPDTLKAIKCKGAQIILAAIGYGPDTPEEMEEYIAEHSDDPVYARNILRMKDALPHMRKIKGFKK